MTQWSMSVMYSLRVALLVAIIGCGGDDPVFVQEIDGSPSAITATVGRELDITLGTVGPGAYDSIPAISFPALRFLDAAIVPPYVPAGPRQRFRFMPVTRGTAVLTFTHSGSTPTVTISVTVE
ncbi:MAG: hypothetical protein KC485_11495 [Gemmatimonadetes bacterium]|nr:hypothetical protein [Gemmatimonadota bacterium]